MAKATGILAGLAVADEVFQLVDPQLRATWSAADGDRVVRGQVFGVVHGSARSILVAERIALNFMQVRPGQGSGGNHWVAKEQALLRRRLS